MKADGYHQVVKEHEPGLIGIGSEPSFAIGQRPLLVQMDEGNILWDCKVLEHLPGWSKDVFYRLERGIIAPDFGELLPLYRALWLAGVSIPPGGPQLFLKYAREKIEQKKTHLDRRTEEEVLREILLLSLRQARWVK